MTIASEITRLQTAKSNIKTSIEWKWVTVPSNITLSSYPAYIDAIDTGSIDGIFTPASFTIENAVQNTKWWVGVRADLWDIATADMQTYRHYFWVTDPDSTAYDSRYVYCWVKNPWSNPYMTWRLAWVVDSSSNYHIRTLDRAMRMKRVWNSSVKVSSLISDWYRASWSWQMTNCSRYCFNGTDSSWEVVSLWLTTSTSDITSEVLAARTTSCWITAEESVVSIWKTSMSFYHDSGSKYNLIATLN